LQLYKALQPEITEEYVLEFTQKEEVNLTAGTRYFVRVQSIRGRYGAFSPPVEFWTSKDMLA